MTNRESFFMLSWVDAMRLDCGRICVETFPIRFQIQGEWKVRFYMYRYNDEQNTSETLVNYPLSGLEMSWVAMAVRQGGYESTAMRIEHHIYKYYEKCGNKYNLRPSLVELWQHGQL